MRRPRILVCVALVCVALLIEGVYAGADYYALLGIERTATSKEIKKAYKVKALEMHPDKNVEDPDAHDKFLKINAAYEVLKDEEMRKKYDQFGEEGLNEEKQRPQDPFANLYDNEPTVVDLDHQAFMSRVMNSRQAWFVNFYSPQCGHCVEIVPDWKETARQLDGTVKVGAVNCARQQMLCHQFNIRRYPSRVFYRPDVDKHRTAPALFKGDGVEEMVKFSLDLLQIQIQSRSSPMPLEGSKIRVHGFCRTSSDCDELRLELKKVSAILGELVRVILVECDSSSNSEDERDACTSECESSSSSWMEAFTVAGERKRVCLTGTNGKQVALEVFALVPSAVAHVDGSALPQGLFDEQSGVAAVIRARLLFVRDVDACDERCQMQLLSFVRLVQRGRLNGVQVDGLVIDGHYAEIAQSLFGGGTVMSRPTVVLWRREGTFEEYLGDMSDTAELEQFAEDAATSTVRALSPRELTRIIGGNDEEVVWIVDFFTPWCGPCREMARMLREAERQVHQQRGDRKIRFGTVDCARHGAACSHIRQYPSLVLYRPTGESVHHFGGGHMQDGSENIVSFINDVLDERVARLTIDNFDATVVPGEADWFVAFSSPRWCPPCRDYQSQFMAAARQLPQLRFGHVDCDDEGELCQRFSIGSYPSTMFLKIKKRDPSMRVEKDPHTPIQPGFMQTQGVVEMYYQHSTTYVQKIGGKNFHQKVQMGQQAVLVSFGANWCGPCQEFKPIFRQIAQRVAQLANGVEEDADADEVGRNGIVSFGIVDCAMNQRLCSQVPQLAHYPMMMLYMGGEGRRQPHPIHGHIWDAEGIAHEVAQMLDSFRQRDEL